MSVKEEKKKRCIGKKMFSRLKCNERDAKMNKREIPCAWACAFPPRGTSGDDIDRMRGFRKTGK